MDLSTYKSQAYQILDFKMYFAVSKKEKKKMWESDVGLVVVPIQARVSYIHIPHFTKCVDACFNPPVWSRHGCYQNSPVI